MLSDYWESPSTSTEAPNEFNIIVEVYLSNAAAVGLRKVCYRTQHPSLYNQYLVI